MALGRRNKNTPKLERNEELAEFVVQCLKKKWPPKAAAGSWNRNNSAMTPTDEAIYQWIYRDPYYYDGDSWIDLRKFLLRQRKNRGMRRKTPKSTIKNRVSINERPEIIDQNVEVGHYEGDLIFHSGSQSANVLTLIDRKTKHTVLIKNDDKRSKTVIGALMQRIKSSDLAIKSITFDNMGRSLLNIPA